jgi:1,2-diacylglycerol 3-alpha-glucosyltransferase
MKIGIVTTWFERGAAYVSLQYKNALEEEGHEVFIYERGGERGYVQTGHNWKDKDVYHGKYVAFPESTYIDLSDFQSWIERNSLEVVFFNEQRWLPPVILCKNMNVKVGAYIDYYTKDTVESFKYYDFLICNTKRHYSVFKWHTQAFYIPWGTDVSLFKGTGRCLSNEVRFFTSVGMNPQRKGLDLLLKSIVKLSELPILNKKFKLIIHSQIELAAFISSTCSEGISLKVQNLIENGKIEVVNQTVTAPGLYFLGDVYVYPSRLEGIGLTIAEAISSGMPIIIPDEQPMNEAIPKNVSKLVDVEKRYKRYDDYYWKANEVNVDKLTEAMRFYLTQEIDLDEYQSKSRSFAEKNLNWNDRAPEISRVFTQSKCLQLDICAWKRLNNKFSHKFPYITQLGFVYKFIWFLAKNKFSRKLVSKINLLK